MAKYFPLIFSVLAFNAWAGSASSDELTIPKYPFGNVGGVILPSGIGDSFERTPSGIIATPGVISSAPRCASSSGALGSVAQAAIDQMWSKDGGSLAPMSKTDVIAIALIESGGNPGAVTPSGTYKGLFQFGPAAAASVCKAGGVCMQTSADYFDATKNASAFATYAKLNRAATGGTALDIYMSHQQGAAGWQQIKSGVGLGAASEARMRANLPASILNANPGVGLREVFLSYWAARVC